MTIDRAAYGHPAWPGAWAHRLEVRTQDSLLDESGRLYLITDVGIGLVHSADMALAADWIEVGRWAPAPVDHLSLPQRWGFVRQPW